MKTFKVEFVVETTSDRITKGTIETVMRWQAQTGFQKGVIEIPQFKVTKL